MMNAGYTNGAGMVGLAATLSHMTGVTTRIGTSMALGNWLQLTVDIATISSFTGGCLISAMLVGPSGKYKLSWRYSVGFILEGTALLTVALALPFSQPAYLAKSLVAFSMGIQNGMTSVWSGGLGRSTHLTGFLADTAIITGFWLVAFVKSDFWKFKFMIPLFFCFMFGAFLGGLGFKSLGQHVFVVPAVISFLTAIIILTKVYFISKSTQLVNNNTSNSKEIASVSNKEGAEAASVIAALATTTTFYPTAFTNDSNANTKSSTVKDSTVNDSTVNDPTANDTGLNLDSSSGNDFLANDFT